LVLASGILVLIKVLRCGTKLLVVKTVVKIINFFQSQKTKYLSFTVS